MTERAVGVEVWTVGHSDRTAEAFLSLLQAARIELVVDVRSAPWSRRHPWHARAEMERGLAQAGIEYRWLGSSLGGLLDAGFEAHRRSDAYREALDELIRAAAGRRTAVMCAERDFRHCHRQWIAEDLAARGAIVRHLLDPGVVEAHQPPLSFDG